MRPTALTVICVIGLCLAGLGVFSALAGCLGLIAQPALNKFVMDMQQGLPAQQMQAQQAMQQEIVAVQRKWMPLLIGQYGLHVVTVVLLFIGCVKGLKLGRNGHKWLFAAMISAIVLEVLRLIPAIGMQREIQAVMANYMNQMMAAGPGAPPPAVRGMMQEMMSIGTGVGIVFTFGWALLKLGFYGWSAWYARKPEVQRLFTGEDVPIELVDGPGSANV